MATTTRKVLGQSAPAATTATTLYTVPASTSAVVSSINVCNRSATPTTFRLAVRPGGASLTSAHYIAYDVDLLENEVWQYTSGITLAAGDVLTVYAAAASISFSAFGEETA